MYVRICHLCNEFQRLKINVNLTTKICNSVIAGSNATNGEKSILMELISKVSWTPSVRFYGSPFSYGFPISCKSVVMRYAILGYFGTIEKWIS